MMCRNSTNRFLKIYLLLKKNIYIYKLTIDSFIWVVSVFIAYDYCHESADSCISPVKY